MTIYEIHYYFTENGRRMWGTLPTYGLTDSEILRRLVGIIGRNKPYNIRLKTDTGFIGGINDDNQYERG